MNSKNNLTDFYSDRIRENSEKLATAKKKLFVMSMLRLSIVGVVTLSVYFFWDTASVVWSIVFGGTLCFLILISKYTDTKYQRNKFRALLHINEKEIAVLNRDFSALPKGDQFKDGSHFFSQDIDLFGEGSFFQYCNRTGLQQGEETLAACLQENEIVAIPEKQEAIRELKELWKWRQEFAAIAALINTEVSHKVVGIWLKQYRQFLPKIMRFLPWVFAIVSIGILSMYFFANSSGWMVAGWFFLGIGITGIYVKKISRLAAQAGKCLSTFQQYQKLILALEQHSFASKVLAHRRSKILRKEKSTSFILKDFASILNALDQRNNMIFEIFGNGFLLWDLYQVYRLEQWILTYGNEVEEWFETIAFFDAYNSFGNFAFNHPNYAYPEIVDSSIIKSKAAGHPLLAPSKRIVNDFEIKPEEFFIITGANMAGKSTFLRTVALQMVMANTGLPVCATKMEYSPIKLITSMRTSDSLVNDESYFFSELKRLKYIVEQMEKDTYFIILDEILKGTNSTDKAIGSQKFVERMVVSRSTGIIATHDLSLCKLADTIPQIKNCYFDAEIVSDELYFDYKFKSGICQNMNASFLLKKMEII